MFKVQASGPRQAPWTLPAPPHPNASQFPPTWSEARSPGGGSSVFPQLPAAPALLQVTPASPAAAPLESQLGPGSCSGVSRAWAPLHLPVTPQGQNSAHDSLPALILGQLHVILHPETTRPAQGGAGVRHPCTDPRGHAGPITGLAAPPPKAQASKGQGAFIPG